MVWNFSGSNNKRFAQALKTGFETDLTLLLGPENVQVEVHKIILMCSSPVFFSKIKTQPSGSGSGAGFSNRLQLQFPEADVNSFIRLLCFLYTGDLTTTTNMDLDLEEILSLLDLAVEFQIEDLIKACSELLVERLSVENVLRIFQQAMKLNYQELIVTSLALICRNGNVCLKQEDFKSLSEPCLILILQQDELQVENELEVFEAVCRWGVAQSGIDKDDVELATLKNVLQWVRFPQMSQSEFALHVAGRGTPLLPMEDVVALLLHYSVSPDQRNGAPVGRYSSTQRKYKAPVPALAESESESTTVIGRLLKPGEHEQPTYSEDEEETKPNKNETINGSNDQSMSTSSAPETTMVQAPGPPIKPKPRSSPNTIPRNQVNRPPPRQYCPMPNIPTTSSPTDIPPNEVREEIPSALLHTPRTNQDNTMNYHFFTGPALTASDANEANGKYTKSNFLSENGNVSAERRQAQVQVQNPDASFPHNGSGSTPQSGSMKPVPPTQALTAVSADSKTSNTVIANSGNPILDTMANIALFSANVPQQAAQSVAKKGMNIFKGLF